MGTIEFSLATRPEWGKELIEAGVDVKTADFHWWYAEGKEYLYVGACSDPNGEPAWSVTALFGLLDADKGGVPLQTWRTEEKTWFGTYAYSRDPEHAVHGDTLVEVLYKLLLRQCEERGGHRKHHDKKDRHDRFIDATESMEKILEFLRDSGVQSYGVKRPGGGEYFSRVIWFEVFGQKYHIIWYCNLCTLIVGDDLQFGACYPFRWMYYDNAYPLVNGNHSLGFSYKCNPRPVSIFDRRFDFDVFRIPLEPARGK